MTRVQFFFRRLFARHGWNSGLISPEMERRGIIRIRFCSQCGLVQAWLRWGTGWITVHNWDRLLADLDK